MKGRNSANARSANGSTVELADGQRTRLRRQLPEQEHGSEGHHRDAHECRSPAEGPYDLTEKRGANRSAQPGYRPNNALRQIEPPGAGCHVGDRQGVSTPQECEIAAVGCSSAEVMVAKHIPSIGSPAASKRPEPPCFDRSRWLPGEER